MSRIKLIINNVNNMRTEFFEQWSQILEPNFPNKTLTLFTLEGDIEDYKRYKVLSLCFIIFGFGMFLEIDINNNMACLSKKKGKKK